MLGNRCHSHVLWELKIVFARIQNEFLLDSVTLRTFDGYKMNRISKKYSASVYWNQT